MERHGGALNAYFHVGEVSWKRLHTGWFQLYFWKMCNNEAVKRLVSSVIKKIMVFPQEFDNEVGMCACSKK